jgi:transposase
MQITTIGLDLAKHVFQVHGIAADGCVVIRRRLRRAEVIKFFSAISPCLIGMEACSSAHHWARELMALGHEVRLMPPTYVKPYVKRGKNDASDAEAICEAVTRPTMRFVPVKSAEQQSVLVLHRTRDLLIRQRTMLANSLRAHCAEFGLVVAQGMAKLAELLARIADEADSRVPPLARGGLLVLARHLQELQLKIGEVERALHAWHRSNAVSRRLETIPGIGPITASALAVTVTNPTLFRSGRHLAAWLGLVPRQNSSGGKDSARGHLQAGGSIYPAFADQRRPCRAPVCKASSAWIQSLGHWPSAATALQAGRSCSGQQDGPDCLGDARPRRELSDNAQDLRRLKGSVTGQQMGRRC